MNETLTTLLDRLLSEAPLILDKLHFIRDDWFYAFIPLFIFLLLSLKTSLNNKNWSAVVDPRLMPFVLSRTSSKRRRYPLFLVFIAGSLCITALAGPVYKKLPQPVYRELSSLVILLDLSQSMNATDIKPSRLARARLELLDLLKTRKTGQTALIVYAANAFVVTPLTDDNATIANLIPPLETEMMPAQGSNLSAALAKTFSLFTQAGTINGNILLVTDSIHSRDEGAIQKVFSQGHRLSILGIGTRDGAPIPLLDSAAGGFLLDSKGAIVIPKLQPETLQRQALQGGGLYVALQADDSDTKKLANLFQSSTISKNAEEDNEADKLNADIWQEEGHWLLMPLLFFAALWARKGWLAVVTVFVLSLIGPLPQPAYADSPSENSFELSKSIDTKHLWFSPDQKAMKAFNAGDSKKAAEQFSRNDWKASAHYRSGNFEAAAEALKNTDTSDGFYNKGNALARLGKLEEAINAYNQAITLDANNKDAKYNREQVKAALENQPQDKQQQKDQSEQGESEQQASEQQASDKEDKEDKQQDTKQQEADKNQNQQNKASPSESQDKQAEQEQLKQRDAKQEAEQHKQEMQQYQQKPEESDADKPDKKDGEKPDNENVENDKESEDKPAEIEVNPMEASISEDEKATEQWLKRIPDDPGGLLRRKFYYQYRQTENQSSDNEPW